MHETPRTSPSSSFSARLGFGMLRIDPKLETHREAIARALGRGIIDFDLGFFREADAHSRFRLLLELRDEKPIRVFLRGGLGEAASEDLKLWLENRAPGVEKVYLLSDPEFAFARLGGDFRALDRELRKDLAQLETYVSEGLLAFYGVGSAAFTYPKDDPEYLSIAHLVSAEDGTRAYPGFRAIEFPLNLYESAALRLENQNLPESPEEATAAVAAHAFGLEVYARRPFDAITETQLLRLVPYPDHHRVDLDEAVKRTLEVAMRSESELIALSEKAAQPGPNLHWAHRLRRQLVQVSDIEQWKEILRRRIRPELEEAEAFWTTNSSLASDAEKVAIAHYQDAMEALLLAVRLWFEKAAAERNERIRARMIESVPALRTERGLARTAMRIYRSLPGLNCVFVGMRSPPYVDEALDTGAALLPSDAFSAIEAAEHAIRDHLATTRPLGQPERH
jgi:hypothetical protein